jgi:hypothetical protein
MSSLKEILSQEALNDPFKLSPGSRAALALTVSCPGSRKDCVLPYIHLLYIKRQDRELVLRFTVAEVRIIANTHELCDKLIESFGEMKIQRISHCEALRVTVAFAVVEQAFEEF